jgi:hypothetical protein
MNQGDINARLAKALDWVMFRDNDDKSDGNDKALKKTHHCAQENE